MDANRKERARGTVPGRCGWWRHALLGGLLCGAVSLAGPPARADVAPVITVGSVSSISTNQATISGNVQDGSPDPVVTIFYGPIDGVTDVADWYRSTNLGTRSVGLFSHTLTGLVPGQVYYVGLLAENSVDAVWAAESTNFVTVAGLLSSSREAYLDSLTVATSKPLSIDVDGNGMSDRWEEELLGGTGQSGGGDNDSDGVINVREFWAGTNPADSNSYMRIISVDLATETSYDIAIRVMGGDSGPPSVFAGDIVSNRSFVIRAATSPGSSKSTLGVIPDNGTGTNVYADTSAAGLYTRRFYDVSVSYGAGGYTNTEAWTMFAQPRTASARYLVCAPVRYGSTNDTNLKGALGHQLARGLHANNDTNLADRIWYRTEEDTYKEFFLATNAAGVYWYDPDTGTTADVPVTVGMPFWVFRKEGATIRNNTVFTGRPVRDQDTVNFNFVTNYGGWTLFGWPLAEARTHSGGDLTQNQLGFYNVGTGGRVSTLDLTLLGDEIWVWKNNNWYGPYQLLGHIGSPWDGRWWDERKRKMADFSLEPGVAYYYRHRTNWGATNFLWRPQTP